MSLKVKGLEPVQRLMHRLKDTRKELSVAIKAGLVHFHSKIAPYPPAPPNSTYERGTDPRSEQMSKQWDYEGKDLKQSLVNRASYSGYVHGDRQPGYHKRTGWKTVETVMKEEGNTTQRIIANEYVKQLRSGL